MCLWVYIHGYFFFVQITYIAFSDYKLTCLVGNLKNTEKYNRNIRAHSQCCKGNHCYLFFK